eukprot:gnl/Trimastix_PCT/1370.p1 GENE.gnl/Trimastix_PCT/1370~~gnl/Trimastix_PCT/1370.p1  ORF type:complete len:908 (+),score=250.75 gnl/Trimastix_PCT/1370:308-3031(+)
MAEGSWEPGLNRIFQVNASAGDLIEINDIWQLDVSLQDHIARTSALRDAILAREDPRPLRTIATASADSIIVQFEIYAPFVSPNEQVVVVGATRSRSAWHVTHPLVVLADADAPMYRGQIEVERTEFPIRYKYAITPPTDGATHPMYECDPLRTVVLPKAVAQDCTVSTGQDNESPLSAAVESGLIAWPERASIPRLLALRDGLIRYVHRHLWRAAGVAIPVFSLKTSDSFGIGEFVDMVPMSELCHKMGARVLQVLPVTDTMVNFVHWSDSYPYSSLSNFALHPIYMSLRHLTPLPEGLEERMAPVQQRLNALPKIDYEATLRTKLEFMEEIYAHHVSQGLLDKSNPDYLSFQEEASYWLPAYAVYKALAERFETTDWRKWPEQYRQEKLVPGIVAALNDPTSNLYERVRFHTWQQYHLYRQLKSSAQACAKLHVALKSDIPIGVDPCSCDTWVYRRFFHMDTQTGAPPDAFAETGQNWGFPTYNWNAIEEDGFTWWRQRLAAMASCFHATRIDHILGFYRIWQIPATAACGLQGHFYPGHAIRRELLEQHGLWDTVRLTKPFILRSHVNEIFGDEAQSIVDRYLMPGGPGDLTFKPEFSTEKSIEIAESAHITPDTDAQALKDHDARLKQFWKLTNAVCLYQDAKDSKAFYPRFDIHKSASWQHLSDDWKTTLAELSKQYFYHWHQDLWPASAHRKFPSICQASGMLICGEDLGLLAPCVQPIMAQYNILGFRVQRMPADTGKDFAHPNEYEYATVATTSTHDMPPLRAWWLVKNRKELDWNTDVHTTEWRESHRKLDVYWHQLLDRLDDKPWELPNEQLERIVDMHMFCPSMLCILPLQDLLPITPSTQRYEANPFDELINNPDNRKHYWQWRMKCSIEDLLQDDEWILRIKGKVIASHRLEDH